MEIFAVVWVENDERPILVMFSVAMNASASATHTCPWGRASWAARARRPWGRRTRRSERVERRWEGRERRGEGEKMRKGRGGWCGPMRKFDMKFERWLKHGLEIHHVWSHDSTLGRRKHSKYLDSTGKQKIPKKFVQKILIKFLKSMNICPRQRLEPCKKNLPRKSFKQNL